MMSRLRNRKLKMENYNNTDAFLEHDGKYYAFDVDALSEKVTMTSEKGVQEIHLPKYELYKSLIEVILNPMPEMDDESDDVMKKLKKNTGSSLPLDFKLAFNTLIKDQIIKEYE
jgi:hypothetical protein